MELFAKYPVAPRATAASMRSWSIFQVKTATVRIRGFDASRVTSSSSGSGWANVS